MNLEIITFDEASKLDKKAGELEVIKLEKQEQFETKIRDLKVKVIRGKKEFKSSIMNPKVDTIALGLEIELMEKELDYARKVYKAVFPEGLE